MNKALFVTGLLIVEIDTVLLVMNVIEAEVAAAIGMLGIGQVEKWMCWLLIKSSLFM